MPGKNLIQIGGVPLVGHSIAHAKASGVFDAVAVSSDWDQLLDEARLLGADYLIERPPELAEPDVPRASAVVHCVEAVESIAKHGYETIVELPPTAPLRTPDDVRAVVALLESSDAPSVVTGSPARRNPYYNLVERQDDGSVVLSKPTGVQFTSRQSAPSCFDLNDAVWAWKRTALSAASGMLRSGTLLHEMPEYRSIDIDTPADLRLAELLYREQRT